MEKESGRDRKKHEAEREGKEEKECVLENERVKKREEKKIVKKRERRKSVTEPLFLSAFASTLPDQLGLSRIFVEGKCGW